MLTGCRQLTHGAPRNFEQLKGKHGAPGLFWCSLVISSISWSSLSSWLHLRCLPGSFAMILEWKTNSEAKWKAIFFWWWMPLPPSEQKAWAKVGCEFPSPPVNRGLFTRSYFALESLQSLQPPLDLEGERWSARFYESRQVGRAAMFRLEEWLLKYKTETVLLGRAGRGLVNGVPLTVTPLHNPPMAKGVGIHSCFLVSDHCNCAEKSKGLYSRTGFRRG